MNDFEDRLKETLEPKLYLTIKADINDKNEAIHNAFREMAGVEFPKTHDNYTLALGKLLEYYETDGKIEALWNAIQDINARLDDLERKSEQPREDKPKNAAF